LVIYVLCFAGNSLAVIVQS